MARRIGSSWKPPEGYREAAIGGTLVVAREEAFDSFVAALGMGTLHAWASAQPGAVALSGGRATAWATTLANGQDVVVRHSRHGGMLRALTRDFFLPPTRAPEELAVSERLRAAGIRTPQVMGYAVYSALGPFCRADVVTARVAGQPLPSALSVADAAGRNAIAEAVKAIMDRLTDASAIHPDLNARNLLVGDAGAWMIDVDRVEFGEPNAAKVKSQNVMRLARSLHKLSTAGELRVTHAEIAEWVRALGIGYSFGQSR